MEQTQLSIIGEEIDYGDLTTQQIKAAEYLAHNTSIPRVAELVKMTRRQIQSLLADNETFRAVISGLRLSIAKRQQDLAKQVVFLGSEQIMNILTQDYEKASAAERREIARTARFAMELAAADKPQTVSANVFAPQMNVTGSSVDAIARRIRELELEDGPGPEIVTSYATPAVPHNYKCHPETDFGAFNYDEETDKRQCHSCGKWMADVYQHAESIHGLDKATYNKVFGIES